MQDKKEQLQPPGLKTNKKKTLQMKIKGSLMEIDGNTAFIAEQGKELDYKFYRRDKKGNLVEVQPDDYCKQIKFNRPGFETLTPEEKLYFFASIYLKMVFFKTDGNYSIVKLTQSDLIHNVMQEYALTPSEIWGYWLANEVNIINVAKAFYSRAKQDNNAQILDDPKFERIRPEVRNVFRDVLAKRVSQKQKLEGLLAMHFRGRIDPPIKR